MATGPDPAPPADEATDLSMPTGDATRVVEVDLHACPDCGASNAAGRRRCGRCGAPLAGSEDAAHELGDTPPTGAPPVAAPPPPADPPASPGAGTTGSGRGNRTRRRRGVAAAFIGGGLLVGAGIGVAAGTGVGPFAQPVEVEFEAASYPAEPEPVRPANTGATSTHPPVDGRTFGPARAVDADRDTAWAPQADDEGARLVHRFDEPVWIDHIEVASGLPDDAAVDGIGRVTGARLEMRTHPVDATIGDQAGVQIIPLPEPVLVEEVTWRVTAWSGGTGALAEVRYRGWPADEADRDALRDR